MRVIKVRNVHEALPKGISHLNIHGFNRDSRNGPVRVSSTPVTTVYEKPCERVIFWPERDANPFFHLYEALWMLQGRNDVAPLKRYVPKMGDYSDDGGTIHGAYGFRWRNQFNGATDQLAVIARRLRADPDDRRSVLQMWDAELDLDKPLKDVPCNTIATFQRDALGALDLTVFVRSNDIVWGAYGANAVHFTILQEYMARWIGCEVGRFYQVSVNYHLYPETAKGMAPIADKIGMTNPYEDKVKHIPMPALNEGESVFDWVKRMDGLIDTIMRAADTGFSTHPTFEVGNEWAWTVYSVLRSHHLYKKYRHTVDCEDHVMRALDSGPPHADWRAAAMQWFERRFEK